MTKTPLFVVNVLVIQCHSTLMYKDTLKEIRHMSLEILGRLPSSTPDVQINLFHT